MGCCGNSYPSKKKMQEAIANNSQEFRYLHPGTREDLIKFRDRFPKTALRHGVCYNLIERNGRFFCPLHPALHNGKDLREGHCDIDHLCNTAVQFNSWDKERQQEFLELLKSKNFDNLDYSIAMENDSLLIEFLKKNRNKSI